MLELTCDTCLRASKQDVIQSVLSAEQLSLKGDFAGAEKLYTFASKFQQSLLSQSNACVNTTWIPEIQPLATASSFMAHNLANLSYSFDGGNVSMAQGYSFSDFKALAELSLDIIADYDSQISCLQEMETVDAALFTAQLLRQVDELSTHMQELEDKLEE